MKIRIPAILAVLAAAPACATMPADGGDRLQSITFETGPCFGACPVYQVRVEADGRGEFDGRRFTAVAGRRRIALTPAQWRAFVDRLAPYRPQGSETIGPGHARCRMQATDHPSATVTWEHSAGADRLAFYFGCHDEENRALAEALNAAPGLLPIGDLIGRR